MTKRKSVMPPRKYQYDKRWSGTVFLRKGASSSFQPKRSSSQSWTFTKTLMSGFLTAPDKDLVASNLYFKSFQGPRWRAGNVAPIGVIFPVVAGAPDFAGIVAILHGARKMRTCGGHGAIFAAGGADQQAGPAAEAEHLAAIRLQLAHAGGNH